MLMSHTLKCELLSIVQARCARLLDERCDDHR